MYRQGGVLERAHAVYGEGRGLESCLYHLLTVTLSKNITYVNFSEMEIMTPADKVL